MIYKQLVQPNLNAKGVIGECLHYARDVFGLPAKYPTAWSNWLATKYKHTDKLPNVAVPVWFSGAGGAGHVVVYVPNKGFYSSPWQKGTTHAVLPSISEIERIYRVKYVGWSEDLENAKVAISDIIKDMSKPTKAEVGNMFNYLGIADDKVTPKQYDYYMARDWKVLGQNIAKELYKQKRDLQTKLKNSGDPTSNDQAIKDSLFNKIKGIFGK